MLKGLGVWFKANTLNLVYIFILTVFFIFIIYLQNKELVNNALANENLMPWYLEALKSLILLLMYGLFIKVFLLTKPFLETINEIFESIFLKYSFVKTLPVNKLIQLSNDIEKANENIKFINNQNKCDAIKATEKHWRESLSANKNYIVTDSKYTYTIYKAGREISHKKIKFKIMKDGEFKFQYGFRPFYTDNLEERMNNYKANNPGDRWSDEAFTFVTHELNDDIPIEANFTYIAGTSDDPVDWISIEFTHRRLQQNKEFWLEISVSHPFGLSNNLTEKERRQEYFETTYQTPHAKRHVTFQVEKYNGEFIPTLVPILAVNDRALETINGESTSTIFYKTWAWEIYYHEIEDKVVKFSVEA